MIDNLRELDYKSIAHWLTTGFFENDKKSFLKKSSYENNLSPNFEWFHNPRNITFRNAVNEFGDLFESIIIKKTKNKNIVLPLSGGLDSRTIAAALKNNKKVVSYSYQFYNGIPEINYAKRIAKLYNWRFHEYIIQKGYLWEKIEELSNLNKCRAEFTHPRQMACIDKISKLGNILISGSMGDLLFDSFSLKNQADKQQQLLFLKKIIFKNSGMKLAEDFWSHWNLDSNLESYMDKILINYINSTQISNVPNKIRAIKAQYYVKNWTNTNLNIFNNFISTFAPYHDERMCEFICGLPEEYLKGRIIQIAYLKKKSPELANIPWQAYDLNLYQIKRFNTFHLPIRMKNFFKRLVSYQILRNKEPIIRNWEIQFLEDENISFLEDWLFNKPKLNLLIPNNIVSKFYNKFKNSNKVYYSHAISMLLTLSVWCDQNLE